MYLSIAVNQEHTEMTTDTSNMSLIHIGDTDGEPLLVAVTEATFPYTEYDFGTPVVRDIWVPRIYLDLLDGYELVEGEPAAWIDFPLDDGSTYQECCDRVTGRFLVDETM
jgi:hypothetical protein